MTLVAAVGNLRGDVNHCALPGAEVAVMGAWGGADQFFCIGGGGAPRTKLQYQERFRNPMAVATNGFIDLIVDPATTKRAMQSDLELPKNKKMDNVS